jgi:NDP-sugar pyrophosphorylase family protein
MTTINLEEFFLFFINSSADMAVACIPYSINIPYAVMETMGDNVIGLKEKPTYTHHCNAGIYLLKREALHYIPKNTFCNATDLMEVLIENQKSVVAYPMVEYWLDIGKPDDFIKAQSDIKHIQP